MEMDTESRMCMWMMDERAGIEETGPMERRGRGWAY
jgi:hypothetical protein